jgi:hypothetical protein
MIMTRAVSHSIERVRTTLDVFRSRCRDELMVVMTGPATAPTVVDQDTGTSVTLEPMVLDNTGFTITIASAFGRPAEAWMGSLPIAPDAPEARLEIAMDGHYQHCIVHWPEALQRRVEEILH